MEVISRTSKLKSPVKTEQIRDSWPTRPSLFPLKGKLSLTTSRMDKQFEDAGGIRSPDCARKLSKVAVQLLFWIDYYFITINIVVLTYELPAARMGMVTAEVEAASEDASMWHRPSKIPPGSMTMQGEWTSPVTTPFA